MSANLIELLDRVATGLLWVQADGCIRHSNAAARRRTSLSAGDVLQDATLRRAVQVATRARQARVSGLALGEQLLKCRVIPGVADEDAFILLVGEPTAGEAGDDTDRLLRAVDQTLRLPLRSAIGALSLWRDDADPHTTVALAGALETLHQRVERLVDLATLWTTDDSPDDERLVLWTLVQRAWADVEPQVIDREVGVRFRTAGETASQATLYGSRRWLQRALAECLAAAVQATPPGGQVEIEHTQDGTRARLVFRQGAMFADDADAGPGTVALALCRQVLALHGGSLGPEPDDGGVQWVLTVPTGAPAAAAPVGLGIAQAQVYARDLAVLMARARRPATVDSHPARLP